MAQVLIQLERPAFVTPELRAWINQLGPGRVVLSRGRGVEPGRNPLLLRITPHSDAEDRVKEEIDDLLTDLRLLGLRPTLMTGAPLAMDPPAITWEASDERAARAP